MRKLIATMAAFCFIIGPALAQGSPKPAAAPLSPTEAALKDGIVLPAASPLRLASVAGDPLPTATFAGRVEISGAYEIELYDDEVSATLWPDQPSLELLPHWDGRGDAEQLYISNSTEFAKAVLSEEELAKLKSGRLPLIRGQASIVADGYEASLVECDSTSYSARFVSVVKNIEIAGSPPEEVGC